MLAAEANFRSRRPRRVAERGAGHLRELLRLLRGAQHFKPNLLTCICSRTICTSSTVYTMSSSGPSTRATGSTADCRRTPPLPRAKAVALKISSKDIPLSLPCPTFGPLLYAARLRTVVAMLILAFVPLVVSHYDGLPIVAIWPAFRRRAWRSRPPKR
jgi:hypothetical protein